MPAAFVIGANSTAFARLPERGFRSLVEEACLGAIDDAHLDDARQVGSVWFGCTGTGGWPRLSTFGQACLWPLLREGVLELNTPIQNIENACATGSAAFQCAVRDVRSGDVDFALAVGVEKLTNPNISKLALIKSFSGDDAPKDTTHIEFEEEIAREYNKASESLREPFESGDDRTVFMDTYAVQARIHMQLFGTTQRQIAASAAKNHNYGALNPKAQYRFQMSVDDVLEDRMVSSPLTRSMCAPMGDGAAAAIVCSEAALQALPAAVKDRAIRVESCAFASGGFRKPGQPTLSRKAADRAYSLAGVAPQDIDLAEIHDATSFGEILQVEMLRFAGTGQGGPFVEAGETGPEGRIPINTSGGLVSKGHPIAATGLSMVFELATQLRGEAGERQVAGARRALQENGGGVMGLEEAACSVMILAAPGEKSRA